MAKAYRTRSTKGPGGTRRYTTQTQGGGVKTTMSYSTGSSSRMSIARNSNGSVVQRTTQKLGDGFTKRTTKTLISKPKTVKPPKPPKPPKMKVSVAKPSKPVKLKPYNPPKQRTIKPKPFKWPTSTRSKRSTSKNSGSLASTFLTPIIVFAAFLFVFAALFG